MSPSDAEVAAIVAALDELRRQTVAAESAPAPLVPAWRWGERQPR